MNDSGFDIGDIISAFRRRAWMLAASIIVITPIVLVIALLLPPYYSSTARILVQSQQIPSDLVRSTVNVAASERLALIQQRLTTRRNLLAMADRLQLFENDRSMSRTNIVNALRSSIEVEEIALRSRGTRPTAVQAAAFTVTFSSRDPLLAARVANELVTMVLQENLETRARRASETREFLEKKSRDLANALTQIETEIAAFKMENNESLPASLASRQSELAALRERRYGLDRQRVTLEEQRRALQDGITIGSLSDDSQNGQQSQKERQLETLRQKLAQAQGVYAPSHPSIRSLQSSIASLEASIVADAEAAQALIASSETPDVDRAALPTQMERNLGLLERQLELVVQQLASTNERIASLEASIAATPDTEIALSALNRRHRDLSLQYQEAVRKEAAATDGEELELNRQAERYEIIEQAQIPEQPDSPPRKLIAAGGFGGSIVFGVMLIVLFELANRTIRTSKHLVARVGLAPIVAIPVIRTPQETAKRRITTGVYALVLIGIGAGIVFLIDLYVTPIDRLVTNLLDDAKLTPIVEDARERFAGTVQGILGWIRSITGGVI